MSISESSSAIARGHELQVLIDEMYEKYLPHATGELATYIPELSNADPDAFGVCLVTADGRTFEAGDCDRLFTIQSISKPFTYGMALEEFGPGKVFEYVGVEPSGDAFNSIELQNGTNRPFNPMINSGAITVTALLHSRYGNRTFQYLLDRFSVIAGRQLSLDRAPALELWPGPRRGGSCSRRLLQAVLDRGDLSRSRDDGRHPFQHGTASPERTQRVLDHARQGHAVDHVHVRDVRLLGSVGLSRGRAGQERRQWRSDHRGESAAWHRHILAAAGPVRKQLPWNRGVRRAGVTSGLARVRLPERGIQFPGRHSLERSFKDSNVCAPGTSTMNDPM
jgi:Glutaminase